MRDRKIIPAVLILLAVLCVFCTGCGDAHTAAPAETEAPRFTVTFYDETTRDIVSLQSVSLGDALQPVSVDKSGCVFVGWTDAFGKPADPFSSPVQQSKSYYGRWRAVLGGHAPYLFPDDRGFLRPDDAITLDEWTAAVLALTTEEAGPYLPSLLSGSDAVDGTAMAAMLDAFFPGQSDTYALGDAVTRAETAKILNELLGRGGAEAVTLLPDAVLPPDIAPGRADRAQLLEACIPHDAEGTANWDRVSIPPLLPSGFHHFDGALYCVDENGSFLCDTDLGTLHFNEQGKYTCGNETLDGYIEEILARLIEEDPEADALTLLRAAYLYTRDSFSYLRRNAYAFRATGWEIDDAIGMLETGRGNCYCYASVFWALARQLGYEARAISGTINEVGVPHAWVEIEIDGVNYYFDPEIEMTFVVNNGIVSDMFMMTYLAASYWFYRE